MAKKRVVITGLGCVTACGNNVKQTWDAILAGKSGISTLSSFDTEKLPVKFGGEIKNFVATNYLHPKQIKKTDPFIHYAIAAGSEALEDSKLNITEANAHRIGVSIGTALGGLSTTYNQSVILENVGERRVSPFFIPSSIANMAAGNFSILHGLTGPNLAISTACAAGTHSIGDAARLIEYGDVDVMVAGGAEHAVCPLGIMGFASSKALSTRNDDPAAASRPWDKDRDGFIISDGAGIVVLEEYEHAKARGAEIYCEIKGFGMSGDAYHITKPANGGQGGANCINLALKNSGLNPTDIQYINAHGTSTPVGDVSEVAAVKRAFKDHSYKLAMSSTKSMTGHSLGAAGGIEAVFTALAIKQQVMPPTINLENPEEGCDLDFVAKEARQAKIKYAISNSLGFGGTNATLVFGKI